MMRTIVEQRRIARANQKAAARRVASKEVSVPNRYAFLYAGLDIHIMAYSVPEALSVLRRDYSAKAAREAVLIPSR